VPAKKHVLISTSVRPRVGKSLLARLLADHLSLAGEPRIVFDTDSAEPRLNAVFPGETTVVDLDRVTDQMTLFDALSTRQGMSQVIDLTHRSFNKFFNLMLDTNYAAEAKAVGVEPVIFYIPDSTAESYDQGFALRERFRDCGFVLVKNEFAGEPNREALNSSGMIGLAGHKPQMRMPQLDPFFASAIEDVRLSLSDFMRRSTQREGPPALTPAQMPLAYLSLEARNGIAAWLHTMFFEIRRALQYTDIQAEVLSYDRFGA
jgi:hypothetical protein